MLSSNFQFGSDESLSWEAEIAVLRLWPDETDDPPPDFWNFNLGGVGGLDDALPTGRQLSASDIDGTRAAACADWLAWCVVVGQTNKSHAYCFFFGRRRQVIANHTLVGK